MSHQLVKTLKRSPIYLLPDKKGDQNWENLFHMMLLFVKNFNCSFHVIDLNQIVEHFITWKKLLPRVQPYFVHTIQRDPKITYFLGCLGCGFCCASYREVSDCITTVPILRNDKAIGENIIISNPFKLASDMKNSSKLGVKITTFMNKSELDRIKISWPTAELLISVITNEELANHEFVQSKVAANQNEIDELLEYAKKLDLNVVGLTCYHGTHLKTCQNWSDLPEIASKLVERIESYSYQVKILNLGDGFDYLDRESDEQAWLLFQENLSHLSNELDKWFPINGENSRKNLQIIANPGKYFVQKAELFAFKVMGKRIRPINPDEEDKATPEKEKETNSEKVIEFISEKRTIEIEESETKIITKLENNSTDESKVKDNQEEDNPKEPDNLAVIKEEQSEINEAGNNQDSAEPKKDDEIIEKESSNEPESNEKTKDTTQNSGSNETGTDKESSKEKDDKKSEESGSTEDKKGNATTETPENSEKVEDKEPESTQESKDTIEESAKTETKDDKENSEEPSEGKDDKEPKESETSAEIKETIDKKDDDNDKSETKDDKETSEEPSEDKDDKEPKESETSAEIKETIDKKDDDNDKSETKDDKETSEEPSEEKDNKEPKESESSAEIKETIEDKKEENNKTETKVDEDNSKEDNKVETKEDSKDEENEDAKTEVVPSETINDEVKTSETKDNTEESKEENNASENKTLLETEQDNKVAEETTPKEKPENENDNKTENNDNAKNDVEEASKQIEDENREDNTTILTNILEKAEKVEQNLNSEMNNQDGTTSTKKSKRKRKSKKYKSVEVSNKSILILENSQYMSFNFHKARGDNRPNYWLPTDGNLINLKFIDADKQILSVLYGNTCDSLDVINQDIQMPNDIEVGDYLIWVNRGTFGSCLTSQFNGIRPPKHFHFISNQVLKEFMELCKITDPTDIEYRFIDL